MPSVITNPNALTIALFIISFLLVALFALVGYIGSGINSRFEGISTKFNVVFKEFEKYQLEKVCKALMITEEKAREKTEKDLSRLGAKVDKLKSGG